MISLAPSDVAQVPSRFADRAPPFTPWITNPPGRGTVVSAELPCGS